MCIARLLPIDIVNAVLLPLALLLTFGVALSVYAGLVSSRLILFNQIRQAAKRKVRTFSDTWYEAMGKIDCLDASDARSRFRMLLVDEIDDLKSLGQTDAAKYVGRISVGVEKVAFEEWYRVKRSNRTDARVGEACDRIKKLIFSGAAALEELPLDPIALLSLRRHRVFERIMADGEVV